MKRNLMRTLLLAILVFTVGAVAAFAADFNGKWAAEVQGPRGTQTITFEFHADGSTLTGKVINPRRQSEISNGTVDGDNISFDQMVHFNGNEVKMHYTGKADGDTIHFSRQVDDRPPMSLDARRVSDPAAPASTSQP